MPMKCVAAKKKVTIKLLVNVNVYGTNPNTLQVKMNKNKKYKIDKYSLRTSAVFDFKTEFMIAVRESCISFTKLALFATKFSPSNEFCSVIVSSETDDTNAIARIAHKRMR